ncbi:MAG: hypothetical protein Q9164_002762 [Protoblastenia rupestris]
MSLEARRVRIYEVLIAAAAPALDANVENPVVQKGNPKMSWIDLGQVVSNAVASE